MSLIFQNWKEAGTYVMLLLVYFVRDCVFSGSQAGGGVRVGVALCDLWVLCQR